MMSNSSRLEDYLELVTYGFTNPMPDADEGPWKITAKDVIGGEINFNTTRKTTKEAFDKKLTKKSRPQIGDVLLTKDGTLGRLAIVQQEGICINQSVAVLRPNEKILPEYLFYLLSTPEYQRQMIGDSDGTVIRHIYITRVGKMEVEIPSVDEQKERLKHLLALDGKMKLNRQTNQTLENIAQAIFKSWFVDFEPTRAKIAAIQNGQDPERAAMAAISGKTIEELNQLSPEQQQSLKTTAALFPDTLVDSEFGQIPGGWEVVGFKDIVKKYIDNRGKTPPITSSGIPLLEVKHLPEDSIKPNLNTTKYVDDETFENWFRSHLEIGDIIISTVGTIGRICMVPEGEKIAIAQNLLGMRFKREKVSPYFMYYQMDGFRFRHDVDARLVITVQASIKRKDLETIDLLSPSIVLQNQFEEFIKPFVAAQQSNQEIELAKVRDCLLPKLLSGELAIESTQTELEEVV